jgi:hypothetical protein
MFADNKDNPFQILGLPTDATTREITEHGEELCATAEPDEQLLYRRAVEELITHPFVRLQHELYEVPGTGYADEAWESFLRKHKRNPIRRASAELEDVAPPSVQDFNPAALMELLLDGLLTTPEVEITPAMLTGPWRSDPDPLSAPLEVQDVIFG